MNDALYRGASDKGCTDVHDCWVSKLPNYLLLIVLTCCDWEIQVFTSGFELEFSPLQLNVLPLSYDAPFS